MRAAHGVEPLPDSRILPLPIVPQRRIDLVPRDSGFPRDFRLGNSRQIKPDDLFQLRRSDPSHSLNSLSNSGSQNKERQKGTRPGLARDRNRLTNVGSNNQSDRGQEVTTAHAEKHQPSPVYRPFRNLDLRILGTNLISLLIVTTTSGTLESRDSSAALAARRLRSA